MRSGGENDILTAVRLAAYSKLPTEKPNPRSRHIDRQPIEQILRVMNREDRRVPLAVSRVRPQIARAVRIIVASLQKGGRLFFAGAGTSGRLGVFEAAECPPTFDTPPSLVRAVMAGAAARFSVRKKGPRTAKTRPGAFF